jgi:hypothetical protein
VIGYYCALEINQPQSGGSQWLTTRKTRNSVRIRRVRARPYQAANTAVRLAKEPGKQLNSTAIASTRRVKETSEDSLTEDSECRGFHQATNSGLSN